MNRTTRAVFKKELKENIPLIAILLILGPFLAGIASLGTLAFRQIDLNFIVEKFFPFIAVGMIASYIICSSAIAYSKEVEQGTIGLLRRLPIPWRAIQNGKAAAIGVGTLVLIAYYGTIMFFVDFRNPSNDDLFSILFWGIGVSLLECYCWGTFWSVRTQKQATAILATFFSFGIVTFGLFALSSAVAATFGPKDFADNMTYNDWLCGCLRLFVLLLLVPRISGTSRWFEIQDRITENESLRSKEEFELKRGCQLGIRRYFRFEDRPRSAFLSLLWQGATQSKSLFFWTSVCSVLLVCVYATIKLAGGDLGLSPSRSYLSLSSYEEELFFAFVSSYGYFLAGFFVLALILTSRIFSVDFNRTNEPVLLRYSISPFKFWASRVLTFGSVYLLILIALGATFCCFFDFSADETDSLLRSLWFLSPRNWFVYWRSFYFPSLSGNLWITNVLGGNDVLKLMGTTLDRVFCYLFAVAFSMFAVGLWATSYFRSCITSGIVIVVAFVLTAASGFFVLDAKRLYLYHPLLILFPIVAGFVVASYIQVRNRLLCRNALKNRATVWTIVAAPILFAIFSFPYFYVVSLPLLPPIWFQNVVFEMDTPFSLSGSEALEEASVMRNAVLWGQGQIIETDASMDDCEKYWNFICSEEYRNAAFGLTCYDSHQKCIWHILNCLLYKTNDPNVLRRGAKILDAMATRRPSLIETVEQDFLNVYRLSFIKPKQFVVGDASLRLKNVPSDGTMNYSGKTLFVSPTMKSLIDYHMESNVFRTPWGRKRFINSQINELEINAATADLVESMVFDERMPFNEETLNAYDSKFAGYRTQDGFMQFDPWFYYLDEVRRRFLRTKYAIKLYYLEQKAFPETLDAVVEKGYLPDIPRLPGNHSFQLAKKVVVPEFDAGLTDAKTAYKISNRQYESHYCIPSNRFHANDHRYGEPSRVQTYFDFPVLYCYGAHVWGPGNSENYNIYYSDCDFEERETSAEPADSSNERNDVEISHENSDDLLSENEGVHLIEPSSEEKSTEQSDSPGSPDENSQNRPDEKEDE